ncbi:MarC family protein [Thiomicrorhabdus sediminis]|uniref:UPF0056 membrane protein n=1 Tax=Thiomicrorhabdus sediminis TaxID=2580412 RepID=A0A4P9K748_9GAMM|nr:MarC family protein [Thiomicrorhabdus sediminis]QCU90934.1 MarC family protein [Thiomicrorhabdus sediminis]
MENQLLFAFSVFMGFFAIMNPVAIVPIFLSLTRSEDSHTTRFIAVRSLMLAFIIVAVFSITGNFIFTIFGLTVSAFQITGGLILFVIGMQMLQGSQSSVQNPSEKDRKQSREAALGIAISPLAMPILAGPGTITTAMSFSAGGDILPVLITIAMFAVMCVITYFLFIYGEKFITYIGASALGVITRMMGMILAVIGTQMVVSGIQGAFNL